jgi:hypothetical protein
MIDHLILHIGIYKTGTTSLQSVLSANRGILKAHEVHYPDHGLDSHSTLASSVMQKNWGWADRGETTFSPWYWNNFVKDLAKLTGTVLISSEFFCQADDDQVARIRASLPNCKITVVIGLRPLNELLWSTYQQLIKFGRHYSVDEWLQSTFGDFDSGNLNSGFWLRNHQDRLISRWGEEFGKENLRIVTSDPRQPALALNLIKDLAGISQVALNEKSAELNKNRSMTVIETEVVRDINKSIFEKVDWPIYRQVLRRGAIERIVEIRVPPISEQKSAIPEWATLRAIEIQNEWTNSFLTSSLKVTPDWSRMSVTNPKIDLPIDKISNVPMDLVETIASGMISAVAYGTFDFSKNRNKYILNAREMRFPTLIKYVIERMGNTLSRLSRKVPRV